MQIINNINEVDISEVLKRPEMSSEYLTGAVKNILQRVKASGDKALKSITAQYDKVELLDFVVNEQEINDAENQVPNDLKKAIKIAANNIRVFHKAQAIPTTKIETTKGVNCWRKSVPIEKVGLYIPGGSAPLFSTVLMLGIPAQLAKCSQVILCTPPDSNGKINPVILFVAKLVGITSIYKVGGAQAIAAMAYGTESIPKVDKVFGPGNQYVTMAKQLVSMEGTAIDMPAGPSEVAIIADETADPEFVAADLLSQAEHGEDSQVILITDSSLLIKNVMKAIDYQIENLPRKEVAQACLNNSKVIVVKDLKEAVLIANQYAPEHLIINCENSEQIAESITHAGSVFIGPYSPESAGDYASGTNHTLPTNGAARTYSGISLSSFMKDITFQQISAAGIQNLGPVVEIMAEAEQLIAHKNAISIRLKKLSQ
jgi:histidinol dehydrogenase